MKRREFLKKGSIGFTLPFWLQGCQVSAEEEYPVFLNSDLNTGHLLFNAKNWSRKRGRDVEVAIVGGGIAGLTAARKLGNADFALFELSDRLGGSVGTDIHQGVEFSQGAHYDLAYPENFGSEVIELLEETRVIRYEPWTKSWNFTDRKHIVPYYRRQQCYDHGSRRKDVIPESRLKQQFVELMLQFSGKMHLPTRLIDNSYHELNHVSFQSFLESHLPLNEAFVRQIDYHMYDDYGGSSAMVSALAGIHYFACRPYYEQDVPLFSPPGGNKYFADVLMQGIDPARLKTSHLVKHISPNGNGYDLEVLNVAEEVIEEIRADRVIYAGQKHALKFIYPDQHQLFQNDYSPWMVVNILTDQTLDEFGFWQNEFLGENEQFLGFIDSSVQNQDSLNGKRIFTGYYCLSPSDRAYLTTIVDAKKQIAAETQNHIQSMLQKKIQVDACYIKVMGHAMPIPKPGYLFRDANQNPAARMIYAGVDNGRLPLLFEALDSGLQAAELI